jgi:hypothetical protein
MATDLDALRELLHRVYECDPASSDLKACLAEIAEHVLETEEACSVVADSPVIDTLLSFVRAGSTAVSAHATDILLSIGLSRIGTTRMAAISTLDAKLGFSSISPTVSGAALVLAVSVGLLCSTTASLLSSHYDAPPWHGWVGLTSVVVVGVVAVVCSVLLVKHQRTYQLASAVNDRKLAALLTDGTVRLLSSAWLCEQPELPLRRCQELPDDAFLSPAAATRLLKRRDRSIAVLSYCWNDPRHPDADVHWLSTVQAFMRAHTQLEGLFWE